MKNLLLIGDSIRMGYDSFVREKLAGKMQVFFPEENCRFAQYTLRSLGDWKTQLELPEIHVVHWNNGLWDLLHLNAGCAGDGSELSGDTFVPDNVPDNPVYDRDPLTPPEMYRYMLGRVLTRLRQLFPRAAVVFATTTGVIEEAATWAYRSNAEIAQYNQLAREVLLPRGVLINDLGAFVREHCAGLHRDWVHFNDTANELMAGEIVSFLEENELV